jgi:hypothetical protein
MFSGCLGVGPDGVPLKIRFSWVSQIKTAARKSKHHNKGDQYRISATMDAEYFEAELNAIGKAIRQKYAALGLPELRVKLQIDSAGGHGMARGHGNFDEFKDMMDRKYNIELIQQPGNTPPFNALDLVMWRSTVACVDAMPTNLRYAEQELVKVCEKAWKDLPLRKILYAYEMRKDCARECIRTEGEIEREGKDEGKAAKRVREAPEYASLRKKIKMAE